MTVVSNKLYLISICLAASDGEIKSVMSLVEEQNADINAVSNNDNFTALLYGNGC